MQRKFILIVLTACAAPTFTFSHASAAEAQLLFEADKTLEVRIDAPISTIRRDRSESGYHDGAFHFIGDGGVQHMLDLKLRPRGRFRRQEEVCDFPPLKLNFRKKQVKDTLFDGQDKLKLVTHCESSRDNYEQNLLQEYLAYRILNTLTDYSFRVRLMLVTYADTERGGKELQKYAFVIEEDNRVAERIGMQLSRVRGIEFEQLDMEQTNLFTVFQYLIGNTDFSAIRGPREKFCCHNAVLFTNPAGRFTPVPYDFDFSGIVNAPYAAPGKQFNLRSVKERVFRGLCRNNGRLPDTIGRFNTQEQEIRRLIDELDGLSAGNRRSTHRYLDSFYEAVSSPAQIEQNIVKECSSATAPAEPTSASLK